MIVLCTKVSRLENNEHILGRNTEGIIDNVSVEGILVCVQQYEIIFASTTTCIPNVSPTVTCRIWQQVNNFLFMLPKITLTLPQWAFTVCVVNDILCPQTGIEHDRHNKRDKR